MLRTKSGLPKFCSWHCDRDGGRRRVRVRKGGTVTYLPADLIPWSETFMRAYAAALEGAMSSSATSPSRIVPGSISELIENYYKLVFPALAPATRATRRGILENFRRQHGDKRVAHLQREHIVAIVNEKAKTPHAANNLRKILRHLLEHAVDLKMIGQNPALRIKRPFKIGSDGFHTWTDEEIATYRGHWPLGTRQRLAMELALELTTRRSDVVRVGPQHVRGDKITVHHSKNNSPVLIPLSDELRAAIEAMGPIRHLTFLATRAGAPRSAKALGGDFRSWCDAAGLPAHCSLHGLRKGGARRIAEAGGSAPEIMSHTGHKTLSEVQRYIDAADRVLLAEQASAKLRRRRRDSA
jgi:integrase